MRDDFSAATKKILSQRVGYLCSSPNCRKLTCGPNDKPDKIVNIGVAAHITAAAPEGPRYNSELTSNQRCDIDNGIWLCQNCAKLIDSDPIKYTVDLLRHWKNTAEAHARRLVETSNNSSTDLNWV